MKKIFYLINTILIFNTLFLSAQNLQSPSEFLGYELGSRFTSYYKVVDYFNYISKISDAVILEKYGEVTVLTSGSQSQIQLDFPVALDFNGISLFYGSNGNVSFFKTLFKNNYIIIF